MSRRVEFRVDEELDVLFSEYKTRERYPVEAEALRHILRQYLKRWEREVQPSTFGGA